MNSRMLFTGLVGIVVGGLITAMVIYKLAPGMMILEDESRYDFDESAAIIHEQAALHGWKIPVAHDLQKTMKNFGKDVHKVTVFELCHPEHAYKILSRDAERVVSAFMPCRVALYERSDNKVYISRMNSALMGNMTGGVVSDVMKDAARESEAIISPVINGVTNP